MLVSGSSNLHWAQVILLCNLLGCDSELGETSYHRKITMDFPPAHFHLLEKQILLWLYTVTAKLIVMTEREDDVISLLTVVIIQERYGALRLGLRVLCFDGQGVWGHLCLDRLLHPQKVSLLFLLPWSLKSAQTLCPFPLPFLKPRVPVSHDLSIRIQL